MGWSTAQGVQSLTQSTPVLQQSGSIAAAGHSTFGPLNISQTGYSVNFAWNTTAAGTQNKTTEITMAWTDLTTGVTIMEEIYFLANSTNNASIVGYGPTKGNQLTVTITNNDTATVDFTVTVAQNSRVYAKDVWQQATFTTAFTGYTSASGNNYSGVLASESPSLAASSNISYILPLWTGRIFLAVSSGLTMQALMRSLDPNASANSLFLNILPGAGNVPTTAELTLPRSMCTLELLNTGASTTTIDAFIIMEYGE